MGGRATGGVSLLTAPSRASARDFDKRLRSIADRHQLWRVFHDFCSLAAWSLDSVLVQRREEAYLGVVKAYKPDEVRAFAELLGMVTLELEAEPRDFLGEAFMRLELFSHWGGQFFSPFELCRMMASLSIPEMPARGFLAMHEPAAGSGAMVIASALELQARGFDYQRQLFAEAWDVSDVAANMAMIQLSLLHIPARVVVGNTLSREVRDVYHTPAFHLGFWSAKLARPTDEESAPVAPAPADADEPAQRRLF